MIKGIEVLECSFKRKIFAQMETVCVFRNWITFLDMKHLIDMAIKFSLTLVEYVAFFEEACVPMGFQEMLSKYQGFTFDKGVRLYSQHNQHHKIEDSINCIGKTISHLLHQQVTRRVIDVM